MMPPALFEIRSFSIANVQTFVVSAALAAVMLLFTVALQIGLGWSALAPWAAQRSVPRCRGPGRGRC